MLAIALATAAGSPASAQASAAKGPQVVATAKILEAKGEVAAAVQVLRAGLASAKPGSKASIQEQLDRLVGPQQPAAATATAAQGSGQDPVDRLIRVLNSGDQTPEVRSAISQLRMLGNLVVPHLIRAFPHLGPFGVMNSLAVMRSTTDPRIGTFLMEQIKTANPEVVTAIVRGMGEMPGPIALSLADELVKSGSHLQSAFTVYLEHRPEAATTTALKQKLLQSEDSKARLWAAASAAHVKRLTEDEALAVVETLSPAQVAELVRVVEDPTWVRIGVRCYPPPSKRNDIRRYVEKFQWWLAPADAAPLLLDTRGPFSTVRTALKEMVRRGWRPDASLDRAFWKFAKTSPGEGWPLYIQALPENGENRAIAAWQQNPHDRYALIQGLHGTENSWTRLAVMDLLAADRPTAYSKFSFNFDWSKADRESIDGLIQFARRWPSVSPSDSGSWAQGLVQAYSDNPVLPVEVVQPLFRSGYQTAWKAVSRRNPERMLELARSLDVIPDSLVNYLTPLLRRHGTKDDISTAVRIMKMSTNGGNYDRVATFLEQTAVGSVEVMALAAKPFLLEPQTYKYADRMAIGMAQGLDINDLDAVLEVLPRLRHNAAMAVCRRLAKQVDGRHVEPLGAALRKCYGTTWTETNGRGKDEEAIGTRTLAIELCRLLGATRSEAALPHLRRVYDDAKLSDWMVRTAAGAALQVTGPSRSGLLKQMLQSQHEEVVVAAVQVEDLRTDKALRELAYAGVLRFGSSDNEFYEIFRVLDQGEQLALALRVLDHESMPKFDAELVEHALERIDGRKDDKFIPQLTKAARHHRSDVREEVARMLGRTFVREAVRPLLDMLKDDDKSVRNTAQASLDQIANYMTERAKWEKIFGEKAKK